MPKQFLVLLCLTLIFLSSCQKDLLTQPATLNSSNESLNEQAISAVEVVDTTSKWYADYSGDYGWYPVMPDSKIIKNGIARVPYPGNPFVWSAIKYDIPTQYNITGDSITFEARVKNPATQSGNFNNYDVALQLIGEQHNAEVHFIADSAYASYTRYTIGNAIHSNLSQLVHPFDNFATVRLVMKNNYTTVYLNSVLLYKFQYGAQNRIGKLKTIIISAKGYATCTKVNLRNSFGRELIFTENFDIDGQSHVVYYK